ncbi:MAG: hypothetical protein LBR26_17750 [Prevotella sp.]|jgi:hypothetical protein|nr:hypothetical protein [Prevotella sp.]
MRVIEKTKLLLLCLTIVPCLYAQVTIGIAEDPAEGALLQLKDIVAAVAGGKNAGKGLLMPRMQLVSHTDLAPMIAGATEAQKKEHTGLVVYNLTESQTLKTGIMVWNGEMWNHIRDREIVQNEIDVKKTLYASTAPQPNLPVSNHFIEATMAVGHNGPDYALPQFRLTGPPSNPDVWKYHYQLAQYWQQPTDNGYSNDVNTASFDSSNYQNYRDFSPINDMSTEERNEVWLFDDNSNDIFHIQFLAIGAKGATTTKVYAALVERF